MSGHLGDQMQAGAGETSALNARIAALEGELATVRRALVQEMAERARIEALLRAQDTTADCAGDGEQVDRVTGLPNALGLAACLDRFIERLNSAGEPFALVRLDVDEFRKVHEWLGTEAADEVLLEISRRLSSCLRLGDVVARTGEDDFVVLLARAGEEQARHVASRILAESAYPLTAGGAMAVFNLSMGVTIAVPGDSSEALLKRVSRALDDAKASRPNNYVLSLP